MHESMHTVMFLKEIPQRIQDSSSELESKF